MSLRAGLLVLSATVLVAGVVLVLRSGNRGQFAPTLSPSLPPSASGNSGERLLPPEEPPRRIDIGEQASSMPGIDFAKSFWGDRWPRVREHLLAKGTLHYLSDRQIDLTTFPDWADVEKEIRDLVLTGGPTYDAADFQAKSLKLELSEEKMFGTYLNKTDRILSEYDKAMVREIANRHTDRIRSAIELQVSEEWRFRQRIWDEKLFSTGPVVGAPLAQYDPSALSSGLSCSAAVRGWPLTYRLDPSLDPAYAAAAQAARAARNARNREIKNYYSSL